MIAPTDAEKNLPIIYDKNFQEKMNRGQLPYLIKNITKNLQQTLYLVIKD